MVRILEWRGNAVTFDWINWQRQAQWPHQRVRPATRTNHKRLSLKHLALTTFGFQRHGFHFALICNQIFYHHVISEGNTVLLANFCQTPCEQMAVACGIVVVTQPAKKWA